jgi:MtN3 and saliva related transmembrane protein
VYIDIFVACSGGVSPGLLGTGTEDRNPRCGNTEGAESGGLVRMRALLEPDAYPSGFSSGPPTGQRLTQRNHRSAGTFSFVMNTTTLIGVFAAFCTSVSYFPQLKKCWETGKTGDLSFMMFSTLATGVAAWVVYGFLKQDIVIIVANVVSFCCLAGILWFKVTENPRRDVRGSITRLLL